MQYPISAESDVHKNSIFACAVDGETGAIEKRVSNKAIRPQEQQ
jgi:hypothetical protein